MTNRGLLTLLLSTLFVTSGCLDGLNQQDDNEFWGRDCEETPDPICIAGPAPDFELVDQFNNPVNMSQFKGKVVVITFVYTHCPDTCPAVTYQMNKLSEELGDDYNESVVFLSVTVDPERDTPESLASFASDYDASWQFLTSTDDSPVGHMSSVWQEYGMDVNIDEEACGGNGHKMEGYEGCHCNPGYMQDPWNIDDCIEDPDHDKNATFEAGLESDIITALDAWSSGLVNDTQAMESIDILISQVFGSDWDLVDTNGSQHSSSTYYEQNLTLIEFFHTDCSHCQNQIPALKEFHANHSSDVNIVSVGGYGLGSNVDNTSTIENFTIDHNATWTYLYDESHQLMQVFGMNSYPSWVLLEGDQIVARTSGSKSYEQLVGLVEDRSEPVNFSEQMNLILENLEHWEAGHMSGEEMIEVIAAALNYEFEEEADEYYGVNHSAKLYIIDRDGNMRVVWLGYDWTYASIYHDVVMLL
jgi:cytochrome oxidase Cu insertion factor (SCO1/SenC/PrrC family)